MVINKSAYDRGFGHGMVYKSEMIDISDRGNKKEGKLCYFMNQKEDGTLFCEQLDSDGLPSVRSSQKKKKKKRHFLKRDSPREEVGYLMALSTSVSEDSIQNFRTQKNKKK